jgi:hypothetical protein
MVVVRLEYLKPNSKTDLTWVGFAIIVNTYANDSKTEDALPVVGLIDADMQKYYDDAVELIKYFRPEFFD